jgi:hypothetical protein
MDLVRDKKLSGSQINKALQRCGAFLFSGYGRYAKNPGAV